MRVAAFSVLMLLLMILSMGRNNKSTPVPNAAPSPRPTTSAFVYERQAPAIGSAGYQGPTTMTMSLPLPASTTSGEMLLLVAQAEVGASTNPAGIAGWILLFRDSTNNLQAWYKTPSSGDQTATLTCTSSSFINCQGMLIELANTSGTPTYSEGAGSWSLTNKTLTGKTLFAPAGSYGLFGSTLGGGNYFTPSYQDTMNDGKFSLIQSANLPGENQVHLTLSNDVYSVYDWAHASFPIATTAAPVLLATYLIQNLQSASSAPTFSIDVSPGTAQVRPSPLPTATAVTAYQADSLVEMTGVNTHFSYCPGTSYCRYLTNPAPNGNTIVRALEKLGVRHIRDNPGSSSSAPWCSAYATLFSASSITVDAGNSLYYNYASPSPLPNSDLAGAYQCAGSSLVEYEGSNEPDAQGASPSPSTWQQLAYNTSQQLYYARANASPTFFPTTVKLLVSPLAGSESDYSLAGSVTSGPLGSGSLQGYVDYGNLHNYSGEAVALDNPGNQAAPDIYGPVGKLSTGVNWVQQLQLNGSSAPVEVTEFGVPNETNVHNGENYVSNADQAKYDLRGFLQGFQLGSVNRMNIYELARQTSGGDGYGIMDCNLNPNAAYTALENMLAILKDPGLPFAPTPLSYGFSGPNDVRIITLEKRDGTYWLVMWRPTNIFDEHNGPGTGYDITTPSTTETFYWGSTPAHLVLFTLNASDGSVSVSKPTPALSNLVTVTDMPSILQVGAVASEPVTATPQPPVSPCATATP